MRIPGALRWMPVLAALAGCATSPVAGPAPSPAPSPGPTAQELPAPDFDALPPPVVPEEPGGAYGFSRYVFSRVGDEIITTLVEGPRGRQVRCQSEDLPCSYLDLVALHESGGEIPAELEMTREELAELVAQLDSVRATLEKYQTIDDACADGYSATTQQSPNMGIHMSRWQYMADGFDPTRPEMLLFAKEDGERLLRDELGQCEGDRWGGEPGFQIVGAAYILPTQMHGDDHPEGFAGPLDNWHVHYGSCSGLSADNTLPREECEARGGRVVDKAGWMIHAYAVPEFDNQMGVFSMWNPTIWPRSHAGSLEAQKAVSARGGVYAAIRDFEFEPVKARAGQLITIVNEDTVPHNVVSGTHREPLSGFKSGILAQGQGFTIRFDEPGEYPYFCIFHPSMKGVVVVE